MEISLYEFVSGGLTIVLIVQSCKNSTSSAREGNIMDQILCFFDVSSVLSQITVNEEEKINFNNVTKHNKKNKK